jgi:hypothetical protein
VLTREVYRLLGQLGALLVDDFASVADARPDRSHGNASAPRPVDETVSSNILVYGCLKIFAAQRQDLAATVPSRSLDPGRYRDVIITVAEQVLYDSLTDHTSDADCNAALRAAYPEWFAEPGYPENTQHQRFRRARVDVRDVLRIIINRDDLRA